FLMGFAGSAGLVVSRAVVRDLFDETESAGVYSFIMMVTGVAPVVAPLLGGTILAGGQIWSAQPWRIVFWVLAALGFVCGVAVAQTLVESLPVERRLQGSIGRVLRRSVG